VPPLRVAVVGTGAFGRNHLRVYRELELAHPHLVQLAALVDPLVERRESFSATYNIPAFASVTDLLAANLDLQAASICVPTTHHADVAEQLLLANLDLLIEKPFAATLAQADHPTAGLSLTKADIPKGEPLRLELEDFLHAVQTRTQPRVPAQAGRDALALALSINDQIAAHAHRAGLL